MGTPSDPVSAAIESALQRFGRMVRSIANRSEFTPAELDDLIQDVRIRLWSALGSHEKIREVSSSYIYRTARAVALDRLRQLRASRTEPVRLERPSGEARLGAAPASDDLLERAELAHQVGQAVEALSEARRPVVRMYLAGYQSDEIAEVLGWSRGRTRNLLYRGLSDLRALLLAQGIGEDRA
jgi:RNA polymerase sigma-70 factor (ECF subfamily)